jgi:hypothetical protein
MPLTGGKNEIYPGDYFWYFGGYFYYPEHRSCRNQSLVLDNFHIKGPDGTFYIPYWYNDRGDFKDCRRQKKGKSKGPGKKAIKSKTAGNKHKNRTLSVPKFPPKEKENHLNS